MVVYVEMEILPAAAFVQSVLYDPFWLKSRNNGNNKELREEKLYLKLKL